MPKAKIKPEGWRNRITDSGEQAANQFLAHDLNARRHPAKQREALRGSLNAVGWVAPVIVSARTGKLLDGHARIEEALSKDENALVPYVTVDVTEQEERVILASFDPITGLATYDREVLDALLKSISATAGLESMLDDLAKANGLDRLLNGGGGDEFDTTPDDGPTRTQPGDLWIIAGKHRVMCGDATSAEDVERLMDGKRASAVLTDPPYGMNLDTDWSGAIGSIGQRNGTRGNKYKPVTGDDKAFDPTHLFLMFDYVSEMFLFGADYYADRIPGRENGSWLVWDKRKESQADAIGSEFELCWSKNKHKRRMLRHDWFGFLSSGNSREAQSRVHPTQKPTSLLTDIITQWVAGDIIVDAYLGSGTTLIAAHRENRTCYGLEIEPRYCDVILKRAEAEGLTVEKSNG